MKDWPTNRVLRAWCNFVAIPEPLYYYWTVKRPLWLGYKMNKPMKKQAKALNMKIKTYAPIIERRLRENGQKADPAIVISAAKYFEALEKLAKE